MEKIRLSSEQVRILEKLFKAVECRAILADQVRARMSSGAGMTLDGYSDLIDLYKGQLFVVEE